MKPIAYYISSHGFGHAARQQAIINQLAIRGAAVHVRTASPQKFFQQAASYHRQKYDIGLIQSDAMTFQIEQSFQWLETFFTQQKGIIEQEIAFIHEQEIGLVVSDMPSIACEIAQAAGVASVVITHFTWDWVYAYYVDAFPRYRALIDDIRAQYAQTTLALQMQVPIPHDFGVFPNVEPIPLVYNPATKTRAQIRHELEIPEGKKLAILSMGGHTWAKGNLDAARNATGWVFLISAELSEQVQGDPGQFRTIPTMTDAYQNYIAHSDVVIGKAGGSTVAEVIGHQTPMIYTTQPDWREANLLHETLQRYAISQHISPEDFESGSWVHILDSLVENSQVWPDLQKNGAEVTAQRLLKLF